MIHPTRLIDFGYQRCISCHKFMYNAPIIAGEFNCEYCNLPYICVRNDKMPGRHASTVFSAFTSYLDGVVQKVDNDDDGRGMWLTEEIKLEIVTIKDSLDKLVKMIPSLPDGRFYE